MKLDYFLLDVFTDRALSGNPLAVVMSADDLTDDGMQAIAREFNLSETAFVLRPRSPRHTALLRIFTPRVELPFAGHPTVGAAVVLGLRQRLQAVRLEESVGNITCIMERVDKRRGEAHFALPILPEEIGAAPSAETIAAALGIAPEEVGCGAFAPALFSAGVEFYLVPVRNAEVLKRIVPDRRGWYDVFPVGHHSVYAFTTTPEEQDAEFAARMFSPGMGLGEDPATGAAAAALMGLLARHEEAGDGQHVRRIRQGVEMGRPSMIVLRFTLEEGKLTRGGIGGKAVIVGAGTLDFSD